MGELKAYRILVSKLERKRTLGRPRHRRKYVRLYLTEMGWEVVDWTHLAQDRDQWRDVVNTVMNLRVP
jgi:hypothetical protein